MATSSLLGIDADNLPPAHSATGIDSLGPSDASDSGSDSAGAYSDEPDSDTDRFGTGERSSADPDEHPLSHDILPDHIESLAVGDDADVADSTDGDADLDAEAGAAPERPAPDQRTGRNTRPTPLEADDLPGTEDNDTDAGAEEDPTLRE